jgi:hypothetical protein
MIVHFFRRLLQALLLRRMHCSLFALFAVILHFMAQPVESLRRIFSHFGAL